MVDLLGFDDIHVNHPPVEEDNDYFTKSFWGEKYQGFSVLNNNLKHSQASIKALQEFIRERATTEDIYAKHLTKLAKSATPTHATNLGSFSPMFDILRAMSEKLSSCHMDTVHKLNEIIRELGKYQEEYKSKIKQMKDRTHATHEALQHTQSTSANVLKSKEKYHHQCLLIDRMKGEDANTKDLERLESKSKKAADDYRAHVEKHRKSRIDYEMKMTQSCKKFQEVEEFHLERMKKFLDSYVQSFENASILVGQVHREIQTKVNGNTVKALVKQYCEAKGTGGERPAPLNFEECEPGSVLISLESTATPDGQNGSSEDHQNNSSSTTQQPAVKPSRLPIARKIPLFRIKANKKENKKRSSSTGKDADKDSVSAGSPEKDGNSVNVDEEGYTIRPETPKEGGGNSWKYVSSDESSNSDSDDDAIHKKIHIKIRPKEETPTDHNYNLETLNKITQQLTLNAPNTLSTKKSRSKRQRQRGSFTDPHTAHSHQLSTAEFDRKSDRDDDATAATPIPVGNEAWSPVSQDGVVVIDNDDDESPRGFDNSFVSDSNPQSPNIQCLSPVGDEEEVDSAEVEASLRASKVRRTSTSLRRSNAFLARSGSGELCRSRFLSSSASLPAKLKAGDENVRKRLEGDVHMNGKEKGCLFFSADELVKRVGENSKTRRVDKLQLSRERTTSGAARPIPSMKASKADSSNQLLGLFNSKQQQQNTPTSSPSSVIPRPPSSASNISSATTGGAAANNCEIDLFANAPSNTTTLSSADAGNFYDFNRAGMRSAPPTTENQLPFATGDTSASHGRTLLAKPKTLSDASLNNFFVTPDRLSERSAAGGNSSDEANLTWPTRRVNNTTTASSSTANINSTTSTNERKPVGAPLATSESWSSISSSGATTPSFDIGGFNSISRGPSPLTLSHNDTIPIAVAFIEKIDAYITQPTSNQPENQYLAKVTGELMMSFPAGIVRTFTSNPNPPTLSFKIKGLPSGLKLSPNQSLLLMDSSHNEAGASSFWFNMTELISRIKRMTDATPAAHYFNIPIINYQLGPGQHRDLLPLHVLCNWKSTGSNADINVTYNSQQSSCPLKNLRFILPIESNAVVSVQTSPTPANWREKERRLVWTVPSPLSPTTSDCSISGKISLDTPHSGDLTMAAVFGAEGSATTLTGADFELVGSGYRLTLIKRRFHSGKYFSMVRKTIGENAEML